MTSRTPGLVTVMPRKPQSQWNFGELFEEEKEEAARKIHSVSEITTRIKTLLNRQIGQVWISGEITNLRIQSSGHIYFSLKDAGAQIGCALFRNQRVAHREYLEDGQKVLINGDVTVYEARGQYQLIVSGIELQGVGALQLKFEQLKQKLQDEGLFDSESKLALPRYPERIGLVTSPTAAALQDVIHVLERRHPGLEIILASSRVQGDGAAREIARQIGALNRLHDTLPLDLILVTRGGGSSQKQGVENHLLGPRAWIRILATFTGTRYLHASVTEHASPQSAVGTRSDDRVETTLTPFRLRHVHSYYILLVLDLTFSRYVRPSVSSFFILHHP